MKKRIAALITAALLLVCMMPLSSLADGTRYPTPDGYNENDYQKLVTFLELVDENGVKNGEKLSESYDPQDPATWKGTTWENGRIKEIYFERFSYTEKCIGKLDVSDCTMLEWLWCDGNQITELDVSNCTALERLICYGNQLTELDVRSNTALKSLGCGNHMIASGCGNPITALYVGQNTALTSLDCTSNQLTELDVSGCTALERLYCGDNPLTSLDVSKNTALEGLSCDSNQLTLLDVSNNTALEWLSCAGNQLTELDVSKNTALEYLRCYGNQLEALNVSGCTALTELNCGPIYKYNPNVIIYSNQLTTLDVSSCTALTELYCGYNQLTSLDVSNNTALEVLRCGSNQLTELDVSNNTALEVLYCGSNQLTELDVSNNTALEWLNCMDNQLTSLDVSNNTALTQLNCRNNQLTSLNLEENNSIVVDRVGTVGDGFIGANLCEPSRFVYAEPKSGSTFVGWYDENDVLLSSETEFDISSIDNKVFIAKFEEGSTEPTPTPEQPTPTPEQPTPTPEQPTPTPEQPTPTPEQPTPTPEQPVEGVTVDFNHNGGTVEYEYDAETYLLTLYFTPKAGYYAKSIYANGSVVADNPSSPYVLDLRPYMKKAEIKAEIYVEFALIPGMRRVTVSSSSCGTVDVNLPDGSYTVDTDGSYLVDAGTELTLTMKPDANHYVWYVAVNGSVTAVCPGNVIKFTVETDMDITVVFRTDAAETTPAPTNPTNPPKTGAISATAMAVTAVLGGAAMLIKRKK